MTTALVTGGTSGIGAAFARVLAERGDALVLVARDADRLSAMADELTAAHGVPVETIAADLANRTDLQRVASRLEDPDRPIEMLINNAGFGLHAPLLDSDIGVHEQALDLMCLAVLVLGGAAGRAMKARGHGRIINVSSLSAWIAQGNYSAVKGWVLRYSEGLANELHGSGVTVTALCPGWVRTEFHERAGIKTVGIPEPVWVSAERVARETLKHAERGVVISIPAKRWRLARFLLAHAPRTLVRLVSRLLTRSRE